MEAYFNGVSFLATPDVTTQLHSVLELLRARRARFYIVYTTAGPLEVTTEVEALDMLEACIRARDAAHGELDADAPDKVADTTSMDAKIAPLVEAYAEPGETSEQTRQRLSQMWFDLNRRNISLSSGAKWTPDLTDAERKMLNELSVFERG